ncbi:MULTISPECIES: patatin family protein [unclassified Corynebacterium]|uniref:patatin-like phospholipase family protein n=1 Tax=unclassified Corynebacterium TaxID=2624378 RepID=UPI00264B1E01|nr:MULTISPECIES: patatin family protein [unclassified Corynebacterium]MDN8594896.1 patatin family protein [Corynebacterium sp. P4_F2]WKK56463.1 patatin family protein [Corynebacterium sp. P4-C1]WKK63897.1 patatin family protein [Corynebacterium sp. P8-C1]
MIDARDTALVIEGGGTRNSYTAPAIMKLIEERARFGWVGGVSAGAIHAINFLSGDAKRTEEAFTTFMGHPKIGGLRSLALGRGLMNAEFMFQDRGGELPFNLEAFKANETPIHIEAVRADTGESVVWQNADLQDEDTINLVMRASSTMPMLMPMAKIDGVPYVDGALGDDGGLLVGAAERAGFTKLLVLATKPRDYVREPVNRPAMIRRMFPKYPDVARRTIGRPDAYNKAKARIDELAEQGNAYVFYPEQMMVENAEFKVPKLQKNFAAGKEQFDREWGAIKEFLEN